LQNQYVCIIMVICPICKNKIESDKLNKTYQISLGNIIKKHFYGEITYYFHIECINMNLNAETEKYSDLAEINIS